MKRRFVVPALVAALAIFGAGVALAAERAAAISNDPDLLEMVNDSLTSDGFSVLAATTVSAHVVAEKADVTDVAENEELMKRIADRLYKENTVRVLVVAVSSGEEKSHNADLGTYLYEVRVTIQAVYAPTGAILVRKTGKATGSSSARDKAAIKARDAAAKDALTGLGAAINARLADAEVKSKRVTIKLVRVGPRTYESAGRAFAKVVESISGVRDLKRTYDSAAKELVITAFFEGDAKVLEERIRDNNATKDLILESSTEDTLIFASTLQEVAVAITGALADNVRRAGLEVFKELRDLPQTAEAQWNYEYAAGEFRIGALFGGSAADLHEHLAKQLADSSVSKDLKLMETRADRLVYKFGGDLIRVKIEGLSQDFYEETGRKLATLIETIQNVEGTKRYFDAAAGQLVVSVFYGGDAKVLEDALRGQREGLGELILVQSTEDSLTFKLAVREIEVTVAGTAAAAVKSAGEAVVTAAKECAKSVTWNFDEAQNVFSVKMLYKGNVNELYQQLTRQIEKSEVAKALFLVRASEDHLAYRYGEKVNEVVFLLRGLNAESYQKVGETFFALVKGIPKLSNVKKSYNEKDGVLTVTGVFPGTNTELDELLWTGLRGDKSFEDVVTDFVDESTIAYRRQSGEVTLNITVANVTPDRHADIGQKFEEVVSAIQGLKLVDKSYKEDANLLKLQVAYRGKQFQLEKALWENMKGVEELSALTLVDSSLDSLSYSLPPAAGQTLTIVLSNVSPEVYKTTGVTFLQAVESLPGVAKVEKTFDTEKKQVTIRLSFKGKPVDFDSRIWQKMAGDREAFRNIFPGPIEGGTLTYAFKEAVQEPFAMVWRIKSLKDVQAPEIRRAAIDLLGRIDGASVVADEYNPTTEELTVDFTFKGRPIEFRKPFADGLAKIKELGLVYHEETVGNVMTYAFASEKQGTWKLDALLANYDEDKDATMGRLFAEAIGGVKGVKEVQQRTVPEHALLVVSFSFPGKAFAFEPEARVKLAEKKELVALRPIRIREDLLEYTLNRPITQPTPDTTGIGTQPTGDTTTGPTTTTPAVAPQPLPDLPKLVANIAPTVVYVEGTGGKEGEHKWLGSGFIISARGYIVTNEHVVCLEVDGKKLDPAEIKLRVKTMDGRWYDAKVIMTDPEADIAVIKVKGSDMPAARLGSTEGLKLGHDLFIIGNPLGLEQSLTTGIVSGLNRFKGRIQTNALINHGNSGGPAFDMNGKVIGIAVGGAVQLCSFGQERVEVPYPGVNFIIPVEQARELLEKIMKKQK